jgi:hypothetical protein
MDWAAYSDVGWGDDVTTTNRHGTAHQWRDGAPGIDTFNVYRRQFGDLKTYATVSGTLNVGVSPYSLDLFGKQYQWPGTQDFSLAGALPTTTGTARMALVFWSPASGTTQGYLGVATGTLGSGAEAAILNRPVSPQGVIPSAFVRLAAGQGSITEFDIWDAREPFRPGLSFGTGTAGLSADMIPISDVVGFYTGSKVEAALAEVPYKLIAPDGGINPVLSADNAGDVTLAGTGDLIVPDLIIHSGDTDTNIAFTADDIEFTAGSLSLLKLTEAGQDLITLGPGSGDVDIDFNGDMLLEGSSGNFGIGWTTTNLRTSIAGSGTNSPPLVAGDFLPSSVSAEPEVVLGLINENASGVYTGLSFQVRSSSSPGAVMYLERTANFQGDLIFQIRSAAGTVPEIMRMRHTGNVSIGPTSPTARLHVDQDDSAGAQAALLLDQADIDEPFEKYIGTSTAATLNRSLVDNADVTTATLVGWRKIEIDDTADLITDGDYFSPFYSLV